MARKAKAELQDKLLCVRRLFTSYKADEYADPAEFTRSLEEVFVQYDVAVCQYVTSPQTGIQRRYVAPPKLAQIVEALDARKAYLDNVAKLAQRPQSVFRPYVPEKPKSRDEQPDGHYATAWCPSTDSRWADLEEWTKTAHRSEWRYETRNGVDGLWVPHRLFDTDTRRERKPFVPMTNEQLVAHYDKNPSLHLRDHRPPRQPHPRDGEGQQT
jgi:hypothetical protein